MSRSKQEDDQQRPRGLAPADFCDDDDNGYEGQLKNPSDCWEPEALALFAKWKYCEEHELLYIHEMMDFRLREVTLEEAAQMPWCRHDYVLQHVVYEGLKMKLYLTSSDPAQFYPFPPGTEVCLYNLSAKIQPTYKYDELVVAHQGKTLFSSEADKDCIIILCEGQNTTRFNHFDIVAVEPDHVSKSRLATLEALSCGGLPVTNTYLMSIVLGSTGREPVHKDPKRPKFNDGSVDSSVLADSSSSPPPPPPPLGGGGGGGGGDDPPESLRSIDRYKSNDPGGDISAFPTPSFEEREIVLDHFKESMPENMEIFNASQERAIMKSLGAKPMNIIEGPPGTGKTRVLAAIINILHRAGKRVLVTAPTNEAVNNLMNACKEIKELIVRAGDQTKCWGTSAERFIDDVIRTETKFGEDIRELDERIHITYRKSAFSETDEVKKLVHRQNYLLFQGKQDLYQDNRIIFTTSFGTTKIVEWVREARETSVIVTPTIASPFSNPEAAFDYCIVDEAGKVQCVDCLNCLTISNKLIIAGDLCQLSPIVMSAAAQQEHYETSFMKMQNAKYKHLVTLLDTQYRSNEKIMEWSSQTFYKGALRAHESVQDIQICPEIGPLTILSTETRPEFKETQYYNDPDLNSGINKSKANWMEAALAIEYYLRRLKTIVDSGRPDVTCDSVFFISPYKKQVEILNQLLWKSGHRDRKIRVGTVDSFQGQEADVVIISMVRSNTRNMIGFIGDKERLNVAITRARRHVALIGNRQTLQGARNVYFDSLYKLLRANGETLALMEVVDEQWINDKVSIASKIIQTASDRQRRILDAIHQEAQPKLQAPIGAQNLLYQKFSIANKLFHDATDEEDFGANEDDGVDETLNPTILKKNTDAFGKPKLPQPKSRSNKVGFEPSQFTFDECSRFPPSMESSEEFIEDAPVLGARSKPRAPKVSPSKDLLATNQLSDMERSEFDSEDNRPRNTMQARSKASNGGSDPSHSEASSVDGSIRDKKSEKRLHKPRSREEDIIRPRSSKHTIERRSSKDHKSKKTDDRYRYEDDRKRDRHEDRSHNRDRSYSSSEDRPRRKAELVNRRPHESSRGHRSKISSKYDEVKVKTSRTKEERRYSKERDRSRSRSRDRQRRSRRSRRHDPSSDSPDSREYAERRRRHLRRKPREVETESVETFESSITVSEHIRIPKPSRPKKYDHRVAHGKRHSREPSVSESSNEASYPKDDGSRKNRFSKRISSQPSWGSEGNN